MTVAHTMKTVADLRRFYTDVMSPANSAKNGWIPDANGDGVKDIRDLAEFKERVYRVTDTDGDGIADKSQVVYEGFNDDPTWDTIGGVVMQDNDLIVTVPPGVYRLHDAKGDGKFSQRSTIAEGMNIHPAFGGHNSSGVMMGPDGRLYWEVGDMGLNITDRSGKTWAYPNRGAVMRSDLDGSNFEVFASGIRNLQEFSFDERGNLISVDNDGDYPGESERVVYLPWGSETGWRSTWQYGKYTDPKNNKYNVWIDEGMFKPRFDGRTAHTLAPIANWHAGPSGMAYNPGTALSDAWKNHFFVTSFVGSASTARIYAFKLEEKGAGFDMGPEQTILKGILAVGVRFGPEGALYVTDWITGWDSKNKGRIWKLDTPETANSAVRKDVLNLLRDDFSKGATPEIVQLLSHADMRVRQKAQFDLVRRGDERRAAGGRPEQDRRPGPAARAVGPGAAGPQGRLEGGGLRRVPDRPGRRDPGAGGADDRRREGGGAGAEAAAAADGHRAARPLLRRRGDRPHRLQAGRRRRRRHAGRQRRPRHVHPARRRHRPRGHRRRQGARGAVHARQTRRCARPPSSPSAA